MGEDITSDLVDGTDSIACPKFIRGTTSGHPLKDGDDKYIRVNNFVLLKHLKDDPDQVKGLNLVATFVQYINDEDGLFKKSIEKNDASDELLFRYRFNDEEANKENGMVYFRKTEQNGAIIKSTLSVKAPLDIVCHKEFFPFKIKMASLEVELCTLTTNKHETRLRPSLCLNTKQKSGNISIQPPKPRVRKIGEIEGRSFIGSIKSDFSEYLGCTTKPMGCKIEKNDDPTEAIDCQDKKNDDNELKKKMDKSSIYDFVSPFPHVFYDVKKKDDCSKFQISFFLVESGLSNCVSFVLPVFLVCIMNILHVRTNTYTEHSDYLANSAALTLTIVFLLANMCPKNREESVFCANTLYILVIFVGLLLSSIPSGIFLSDVQISKRLEADQLWWPHLSALPSYIGAVVFFCSLLIPAINFGRYKAFENRMVKELDIHKIHFKQGKKETQFEVKENHFADYFSSICGLTKKKLNDIGYTKHGNERNYTVTYVDEKNNTPES